MRLTYTFILASNGLRAKPMRTFLTLLGVAIGVAAVVAIAALGAGVQALVLNDISGLGANVIAVQPGRPPKGPADITQTLYSDSLVAADVDAIERTQNAPHVVDVMPLVFVPGVVSYQGQTYVSQTIGGNAQFMGAMFNVYPAEGELFGKNEVNEKEPVAMIGSKVKDQLFGQSSAVGEKITIKDVRFKVTSVLPPTGQVAFADFDDMVLIPYTTAQAYLTGHNYYNEFIVKVDDPKNVDVTKKDIEMTLRERHKLEPGEEDDFTLRTPASLMAQVGSILTALTVFLASVVGIALVVGGIGIMNIMLVSVAERTKEIGLRKAVGATDGNILMQFILEAVFLTLLGGAVGVLAGSAVAYGANIAIHAFTTLEWSYVFPLPAAIGALAFSVLIGLIFGLYPARKASKKSPMEALRYE